MVAKEDIIQTLNIAPSTIYEELMNYLRYLIEKNNRQVGHSQLIKDYQDGNKESLKTTQQFETVDFENWDEY